ncbi:MAG: 30S ribosomal protein S7 [Bacteroidota bacterium]|nr:30S ribosomal protein S7 [Bacteroidota bacterium]MDP4233858.1 30S ribosomal protein S7 [Bacteroidota bacterium]MDP4243531.1 30S ribosomal protein S7 [Bacteroidota bacterium]MDP4288931.1 30S ribosomal protein S7 [Bacteroidota bacterium]
MRKHKAEIRPRVADPKYNDTLVSQFINSLMLGGRKSTAQRIMYDAMEIAQERTGQPGLDIFKKAMTNAAPLIEVRSRRVGGATYQVPTEVRTERRTALAIRWLINYSRARGEKSMAQRLAGELVAASNNEGTTVKKRDDTHRMAEANKAFAHFRF